MARARTLTVTPPDDIGRRDGIAYALFLPAGEPTGGVVILHGATSCKESHYDFARAARAQGLAAVAFDMRGHGESEGELDHRAIADVVTIAGLLPPGPVALRGSSMGGYFAVVAAEAVRARAVVAICPASGAGLRRLVAREDRGFAANVTSLDALLSEHEALDAVTAWDGALLLMHAEGDEVVPVAHSRALLAAAAADPKRLVAPPGGHHRSVQHDPDLQAHSLRFIARALRPR